MFTVNVAVVDPAVTVTVPGTVAAKLLEANVMTVPPVGAGSLRVTLPVLVEPPMTDVGERVNVLRDNGAVTVRAAEAATPPDVAVIVGLVVDVTAVVEIVNVPVV